MSNLPPSYSNTISKFNILYNIIPRSSIHTPAVDDIPIIIGNRLPIGAIIHFSVLFSSTNIMQTLTPYALAIPYPYKQSMYHNPNVRYDFEVQAINEQDLLGLIGGDNSTSMYIAESYVKYLSAEHPNRIGMRVKLLIKTHPNRPKLVDIMKNTPHDGVPPTLPHDTPQHFYLLAYVSGADTNTTYNDSRFYNKYLFLISSDDPDTALNMYMASAFSIEFALPVEFAVLDYSYIDRALYSTYTNNRYLAQNFTQHVTTDYLARVYNIRI